MLFRSVLWYGPAALLVFGFAMVAVIVFRRRRAGHIEQDDKQLSGDEQSRLSDILKQHK